MSYHLLITCRGPTSADLFLKVGRGRTSGNFPTSGNLVIHRILFDKEFLFLYNRKIYFKYLNIFKYFLIFIFLNYEMVEWTNW